MTRFLAGNRSVINLHAAWRIIDQLAKHLAAEKCGWLSGDLEALCFFLLARLEWDYCIQGAVAQTSHLVLSK
jgi:hypothetical protein